MDKAYLQPLVTFLSILVTGTGVFVAYRGFRNAAAQLKYQREQLNDEYLWRRRQYAVNMLGDWNSRVVVHRMCIEAAFPGLMDPHDHERHDKAKKDFEDRIHKIYRSSPEKRRDETRETDWELREHFIELLNYCEYVASSHEMLVGDQEMLENTFGGTLIRWYDVLLPFINVVKKCRCHNPWEPLERFAKRLREVHHLPECNPNAQAGPQPPK